eukprot:CAMPEP_0194050464 /NCGR_PEP_ID=MMETSP0009_2-20130614/35462_1 /TAXON_ID=210454 /ORGANISM="Grammatophora oceanica, Strain CCMP 410" /LENGTH=225 /DNA_ID=CAMNT_0038697107 /DNA_START=81 /DNA_END=758 /DNA_ORIENTATION=-
MTSLPTIDETPPKRTQSRGLEQTPPSKSRLSTKDVSLSMSTSTEASNSTDFSPTTSPTTEDETREPLQIASRKANIESSTRTTTPSVDDLRRQRNRRLQWLLGAALVFLALAVIVRTAAKESIPEDFEGCSRVCFLGRDCCVKSAGSCKGEDSCYCVGDDGVGYCTGEPSVSGGVKIAQRVLLVSMGLCLAMATGVCCWSCWVLSDKYDENGERHRGRGLTDLGI